MKPETPTATVPPAEAETDFAHFLDDLAAGIDAIATLFDAAFAETDDLLADRQRIERMTALASEKLSENRWPKTEHEYSETKLTTALRNGLLEILGRQTARHGFRSIRVDAQRSREEFIARQAQQTQADPDAEAERLKAKLDRVRELKQAIAAETAAA